MSAPPSRPPSVLVQSLAPAASAPAASAPAASAQSKPAARAAGEGGTEELKRKLEKARARAHLFDKKLLRRENQLNEALALLDASERRAAELEKALRLATAEPEAKTGAAGGAAAAAAAQPKTKTKTKTKTDARTALSPSPPPVALALHEGSQAILAFDPSRYCESLARKRSSSAHAAAPAAASSKTSALNLAMRVLADEKRSTVHTTTRLVISKGAAPGAVAVGLFDHGAFCSNQACKIPGNTRGGPGCVAVNLPEKTKEGTKLWYFYDEPGNPKHAYVRVGWYSCELAFRDGVLGCLVPNYQSNGGDAPAPTHWESIVHVIPIQWRSVSNSQRSAPYAASKAKTKTKTDARTALSPSPPPVALAPHGGSQAILAFDPNAAKAAAAKKHSQAVDATARLVIEKRDDGSVRVHVHKFDKGKACEIIGNIRVPAGTAVVQLPEKTSQGTKLRHFFKEQDNTLCAYVQVGQYSCQYSCELKLKDGVLGCRVPAWPSKGGDTAAPTHWESIVDMRVSKWVTQPAAATPSEAAAAAAPSEASPEHRQARKRREGSEPKRAKKKAKIASGPNSRGPKVNMATTKLLVMDWDLTIDAVSSPCDSNAYASSDVNAFRLQIFLDTGYSEENYKDYTLKMYSILLVLAKIREKGFSDVVIVTRNDCRNVAAFINAAAAYAQDVLGPSVPSFSDEDFPIIAFPENGVPEEDKKSKAQLLAEHVPNIRGATNVVFVDDSHGKLTSEHERFAASVGGVFAPETVITHVMVERCRRYDIMTKRGKRRTRYGKQGLGNQPHMLDKIAAAITPPEHPETWAGFAKDHLGLFASAEHKGVFCE